MSDSKSPHVQADDKKPFVIKVRWIVIAILAYMLVFNYLLYEGSKDQEPKTSTESANE